LFIPMLVVFLRILRDPTTHEPMAAKQAAEFIMSHYFDHMLMLILGGFSISKAFSKYQLEQKMGAIVFSWVGTNPRFFLLELALSCNIGRISTLISLKRLKTRLEGSTL